MTPDYDAIAREELRCWEFIALFEIAAQYGYPGEDYTEHWHFSD